MLPRIGVNPKSIEWKVKELCSLSLPDDFLITVTEAQELGSLRSFMSMVDRLRQRGTVTQMSNITHVISRIKETGGTTLYTARQPYGKKMVTLFFDEHSNFLGLTETNHKSVF